MYLAALTSPTLPAVYHQKAPVQHLLVSIMTAAPCRFTRHASAPTHARAHGECEHSHSHFGHLVVITRQSSLVLWTPPRLVQTAIIVIMGPTPFLFSLSDSNHDHDHDQHLAFSYCPTAIIVSMVPHLAFVSLPPVCQFPGLRCQ